MSEVNRLRGCKGSQKPALQIATGDGSSDFDGMLAGQAGNDSTKLRNEVSIGSWLSCLLKLELHKNDSAKFRGKLRLS